MASQPLAVRQLKDVPALRQMFSLVLVAAAVAGGIALYMWAQKPAFTPLYSGLGDKETAEIIDALRAASIPYQIEGGAVSVPAAQVTDARLRLAGQGLPRSSSQGFEMIQQEQGFGTSNLIEAARYQHALETELARTIAGLQPVANARVHLALPKPSAFTRGDAGSAAASVLVELRGGRSLEQEQVASIVHLVASSVPGLNAAAVSVIDQGGRLLTRPDGDSAMQMTGEQYDYARRVERDLAQRIEALLTPMMGPGRTSAQVSAEIDFAVTEEAKESYSPNPQAVRSEQSSENTNRGSSGPLGVPGATSNQPPAPAKTAPIGASAATAADVQTQSREMTRNYELDKTLSHTRQATGTIKRLSVAVLVDNRPKTDDKGQVVMTPLNTDELTKVDLLVKQAVGFSAARGDTVSIQNSAFLQPEAMQAPAEPAFWKNPEFQDMARSALGAITLMVMFITVLRPLLKSVMQAPLAAPAFSATPALESGGQTGAVAATPDDRLSLTAPSAAQPYEARLQVARAAVAQDPKRVAQVVKTWVGEE